MAASGEGKRRWLACSCFGCLGVIVIIALVALGLTGVAWKGVKSEEVADQVLTPQIAGRAPSDAPSNDPGAVGAGRVLLNLSDGGFNLLPADPGQPLRIEARYDTRSYRLVEDLTDSADGWSYSVRFRRTSSSLINLIKLALGGSNPEIDIYLPLDVPIELELDVAQGGGKIELGGLWLTSAELRFGQGGFEISIDEPLREPMERLSIHGSMGGFSAERLGNASPRELDVDVRMGGMDLDLRGAWLRDADVSIAIGMGGGSVRLPRDVRIVGLPGERMVVQRDPEIRPSTLTFSVSGDPDSLQFLD